MKNYEFTIGSLGDLETIISEAERHKNAYFWSSVGNAYARRRYEREHNCELVQWIEGGKEYTAKYVVSCSCHYVYAYGVYTRDDHKTNLTAIRNSFKRMCECEQ